LTPDQVISELRQIRSESAKGVEALYAAEVKFAELDRAADVAEAKALINAQGTVVDRQAVAKVATAEARLAADVAKAEWNRVKAKIRLLESQQMSLQSEAKLVEMQWRG
jgi:hypothetical protein